jgi:hypothetical protein
MFGGEVSRMGRMGNANKSFVKCPGDREHFEDLAKM